MTYTDPQSPDLHAFYLLSTERPVPAERHVAPC